MCLNLISVFPLVCLCPGWQIQQQTLGDTIPQSLMESQSSFMISYSHI